MQKKLNNSKYFVLIYFVLVNFISLFGAHIDHESGEYHSNYVSCSASSEEEIPFEKENFLDHFLEASIDPEYQKLDLHHFSFISLFQLSIDLVFIQTIDLNGIDYHQSILTISANLNKAPPAALL